MIKKRVISSILALTLAFSFAGCGSEAQETSGEASVALIDPVVSEASSEKAAYRNIYNYKTYAATVYPVVEEYSFSRSMNVSNIPHTWGEEIEAGTVLAVGSTEDIDEQIENLEERIASMDENILKSQQRLDEGLAPDIEEEKRLVVVLGEFDQRKPAEMVPASSLDPNAGSEMVSNPAYTAWANERRVFEGKYRILAHNIDMREEAFRQQKELYELERAYLVSQINGLKKSRTENTVTSEMTGEVVGITLKGGTYMEAEEPVVAIGDMSQTVLMTEYISQKDMSKAVDFYAFVDGKRYEVEYVPISNDEYTKITADGSKAYTTFKMKEEISGLEVGDYVVITVFTDKKENVLSVPAKSLRKDENGQFLYVMKNGESVYTPVKTGVTDGVYTEILSGVEEGDEIIVENVAEYGQNTAKVTYGSYSTEFKGSGEIYYFVREEIKNPVQYGTTYFGEYKVELNQYVQKGDVIATVRVKADDITIQRNKVKLQRAQERLNEIIAEDNEDNAETIEAKREEIADIEELLRDMEKDAAVTEILATRSGVVTKLERNYEAETIIYHESFIAEIADDSSCYVEIENSNNLLNYGNQVTISFQNNDGETKTSPGRVASICNVAVSGSFVSNYVLIQLPKESIEEIANTRIEYEGSYYGGYRTVLRSQVTAKVRSMENVLVVPKSAVKEIEGRPYVYVKDEQGNAKAVGFVAAGYNAKEYWVIEGLTEGMEVCLK